MQAHGAPATVSRTHESKDSQTPSPLFVSVLWCDKTQGGPFRQHAGHSDAAEFSRHRLVYPFHFPRGVVHRAAERRGAVDVRRRGRHAGSGKVVVFCGRVVFVVAFLCCLGGRAC